MPNERFRTMQAMPLRNLVQITVSTSLQWHLGWWTLGQKLLFFGKVESSFKHTHTHTHIHTHIHNLSTRWARVRAKSINKCVFEYVWVYACVCGLGMVCVLHIQRKERGTVEPQNGEHTTSTHTHIVSLTRGEALTHLDPGRRDVLGAFRWHNS